MAAIFKMAATRIYFLQAFLDNSCNINPRISKVYTVDAR
jgi:hypothetical protein